MNKENGNFVVYLTMYSGNKLPKWYIGSTSKENIDKGYNGSVSSKIYSKIWLNENESNPQLFKTKVLSYHDIREDAYKEEERLQRLHNVVENKNYINLAIANSHLFSTPEILENRKNDIDENGLNSFQRASRKMANTMLNDIDENGLNGFQRAAIKTVKTKNSDIDENGLNNFQRGSIKAYNSMLSDIDDNGLNGIERMVIKWLESKRNNIDENGLNGFQRSTVKSVETKLNAIDENGLNVFQRSKIKADETMRNDIDENGLNGHQRMAIKCLESKRNNIDENGLDGVQRGIKNMVETMLNDIDENGLNTYQRSNIKSLTTLKNDIDENGISKFSKIRASAVSTMLNDIDENGLNTYQRIALINRENGYKDIDENGLNRFQRIASKMMETKLNDVDENGLNSFQRASIKSVETKLNDVDENGLNGFQRASIKIVETKLNDVDENGLNGFQRSAVQCVETKLNDIDENGLNGHQRASRKMANTMLNDIDENGLNTYQRIALINRENGYKDIDENGLNRFQRTSLKVIESRRKSHNTFNIISFDGTMLHKNLLKSEIMKISFEIINKTSKHPLGATKHGRTMLRKNNNEYLIGAYTELNTNSLEKKQSFDNYRNNIIETNIKKQAKLKAKSTIISEIKKEINYSIHLKQKKLKDEFKRKSQPQYNVFDVENNLIHSSLIRKELTEISYELFKKTKNNRMGATSHGSKLLNKRNKGWMIGYYCELVGSKNEIIKDDIIRDKKYLKKDKKKYFNIIGNDGNIIKSNLSKSDIFKISYELAFKTKDDRIGMTNIGKVQLRKRNKEYLIGSYIELIGDDEEIRIDNAKRTKKKTVTK